MKPTPPRRWATRLWRGVERYRRHGRRAALLPAFAGGGKTCRPALDRSLLRWTVALAEDSTRSAGRRRPGACGLNGVRYRGLRCGAAGHGAAARWRTGGRCNIRLRAAWAYRALGLRKQRGTAWARHLTSGPPAGTWGSSCDSVYEQPQRWTLAMAFRWTCTVSPWRPACRPSSNRLRVFPGASMEQALHGGEDYELLFTVRSGIKVPAHFQDISLTKIGEMQRGRAGAVTMVGAPLPPLGYDHFRGRK